MKSYPLLILLSLAGVCHGSELPPWSSARQTILGCYGGWDVEVTLSAGYEQRSYFNGPVDGPFANGTISVPIYSRKQRLERQEHTNAQLEHLAELYAQHQSQTAIMNAMENEKAVLKRTMLDDGASGISAYYNLIKEVEKARSERDSARRKIITWLELCGYQGESDMNQTTEGKDYVAGDRVAGAGLSAQ